MIDWRRKWQPTLILLPGKSYGQRSLMGYSPRVAKSQTRLSNLATHARKEERWRNFHLWTAAFG